MNKKLPILGILLLFMAFIVNTNIIADFSLDATSKNVVVNFDDSKTVEIFKFDVDSLGNLTGIVISFDDFINANDEKIDVVLSYPPNVSANSTGAIVEATITVSNLVRLEDDITRTLTITGNQNGSPISMTFDLTIDVRSQYLTIEIDDEDDIEELEPGDDFSFVLVIDNIAIEDIENVEVDVDIINIDGGDDDIDDSSSKIDIDENKDEDFDFDFTVPLNTEDGRYDMELKITGELRDSNKEFTYRKVFTSSVEVEKNEDVEVQFGDVEISQTSGLTCGAALVVDATAVNTGDDDIDERDISVRLYIEESGSTAAGRVVDEEYDDFSDDLEGDSANRPRDREEDVRFTVVLPNSLSENTYTLRLLAFENNRVVGEYIETLSVVPCVDVEDEDQGEEQVDEQNIAAQQEDKGTIFLPTGFSTLGLEKEEWTTIFWILGNVVLLIIAIYFLTLIFRRRR